MSPIATLFLYTDQARTARLIQFPGRAGHNNAVRPEYRFPKMCQSFSFFTTKSGHKP